MAEAIIELILRLSVIQLIVLSMKYFDIIVKIINTPEKKIIRDSHSKLAFLSEIFQPK
jgi:hypothetical protein